jgi:predicted homoserine dehydrogenase-like protein
MLVDVTGSVEFGAHVALGVQARQGCVLMNAELMARSAPFCRPMPTGTA